MQKIKEIPLIGRVIGTACLDPRAYDEVDGDIKATPQAVLVVAVTGLAAGIGSLGTEDTVGLVLIANLSKELLVWGLWTITSYFVGTTLFRSRDSDTTPSWRQLLRTTGFAQSPGLLRVTTFVPYVGLPIFIVSYFWQMAAMTVAVRQTLKYASTWRALTVVLSGFIIMLSVLVVVRVELGL